MSGRFVEDEAVRPYCLTIQRTSRALTTLALKPADQLGLYINGGYWILRPEVFDHIKPGEEVVEEPMQRMIRAKKLMAYRYDGFWACMDTFKEKMMLDDMVNAGKAKWQLWANSAPSREQASPELAPQSATAR